MVKALLVNYTDVPLKYFVREREGGRIAPERFNTLYPQSRIMVPTSSGREIILRWADMDNGNRYRETYGLENDITLVLTFDPRTTLFNVEAWDGIRTEEGSMVEEVRLKSRPYRTPRDPPEWNHETFI